MPTVKARLEDAVGRLLFKELAVEDVRDVAPHFRRLQVGGDALRTATISAGDKIQVLIPGVGTRTYTPFAHNAARGTFDLLAYVHGEAPGAQWTKRLATGVHFRAFGPRGSLSLATLPGPVVFFGDETSFAAAKALSAVDGRSAALDCVFEATHTGEAKTVLAELQLERHVVVQKESADGHIGILEEQLRAALARQPTAHLVLTGHAQMIQALRARLKVSPIAHAGQKVKAYWADGKTGLD